MEIYATEDSLESPKERSYYKCRNRSQNNASKWSTHRSSDYTVKAVFSSHSKEEKMKVLKTVSSSMPLESIAEFSSIEECSGAFSNTFDLHEAITSLVNRLFVFY